MAEPTVADLAERLQRLEDLAAINQLFIDYGRFLDASDFASYATLFAEDGEVMLGPLGRATGPAAIRELMERALAGQEGASVHVISSPTIVLDGDRATTEVMWTVVHRMDDGSPKLTAVGRHRDEVVRRDGRWLFRTRRGFVDIPKVMKPTGAPS